MEGKELIASLASMHAKLDEIRGYFKGRATKSEENANGYLARKTRRRKEEDHWRSTTVKNPDCLSLQMLGSSMMRVSEHFVKVYRLQVWLLMLDDKRNNAAKIVEKIVRHWNNYHWEPSIKRSGDRYACFCGWTKTKDGRWKAKRQRLVPAGDVVFKAGKFATTKQWGIDKAGLLGEPAMWYLLDKLVGRVMQLLKYPNFLNNDEDVEYDKVADDWDEVNPECLLWLNTVGDGYSFSEDWRDKLWLCRPSRLWQFHHQSFNKKIGKIMPILCAMSHAFDRGLEKTVGSC